MAIKFMEVVILAQTSKEQVCDLCKCILWFMSMYMCCTCTCTYAVEFESATHVCTVFPTSLYLIIV